MRTLAKIEDRRDLLNRLARLSEFSPNQWGRMTPGGMVCHLEDSFAAAMGERKTQLRPSLLWRTVVKWGAFYVPRHWPKGVDTVPDLAQEMGGTQPSHLQDDKVRLAGTLGRFCEMDAKATHVHCLFGRLTRREWMRWGYLHMDHHLRQFGC